MDNTNDLAPYFGIVRFYFTITVIVKHQPKHHYLSYVTWLKFRLHDTDPLSRLYWVTKDVYQRDRIISPRRFLCRCALFSLKPKFNDKHFMVSDLPKWGEWCIQQYTSYVLTCSHCSRAVLSGSHSHALATWICSLSSCSLNFNTLDIDISN